MKNNWNLLIIGSGVMGRGIAQVFATKGIKTTLYDVNPEQLEKAKGVIQADMDYLKTEGMVNDEEIKNTQNLISYEKDLEKCAPKANIVIEAVYENADVKRDTYNQLDKYCTKDCILCSNTSSMNVYEIAQVSHPERLIITHFFTPTYVMPLVEIVMGPETSPEIRDIIKDLLIQVGKEPVVISTCIPGFIVNRLTFTLAREVAYMVTQGWVTAADVERAIHLTHGLRYAFEGPLILNDVCGWDLGAAVSKVIQPSLCNDTTENRLSKVLVEKGQLGLKSGKGVFDYSGVDPLEYVHKRSHRIIKMIKAVKTLDDPE